MSGQSALIRSVRGWTPKWGEGTFLAETCALIGDVQLGRNCSVWYNAVLRGDVMPIRIGDETNIQDGSVIHGTFNKCGAVIGHRVTVGHSVILHGCEIGDLCLIGMGSVIMDLAKVPPRSVVGGGSLVTEGAQFPEGYLILGRPAKAVRPLTEKELSFLSQSASNYIQYKAWYQNEGVSV